MNPYDSQTGSPGFDSDSGFRTAATEEPSQPIKELVSEFLEQGRRLVRAEVRLARAEVRHELKKTTAGAGLTAGGGLVLLLGAFTFVAFLVIALAGVMPLWASALIVAVVLLAAGAGLTWFGLQRLKTIHGPTKTIQTLKEDSQWASRTMQSMKSQMHGHA
ncbi:MAG: phage holin family protein [Hyalangium sp.]|uniref:phage holin family protein n=1 Tax=Hyalangium sp. TaxID=2028555 RepID=UPI00389AB78E